MKFGIFGSAQAKRGGPDTDSGAGFRDFVERQAERNGVEGWVRNRRDGAVEAVFSGPEEAVTAMLAALRRGPPGAHVAAIDQREGTADDLALIRTAERFSLLSTV